MYTNYQDIYNKCNDLDFELDKIKEFCLKEKIIYDDFINQAKFYAKYFSTKKITDLSKNEMFFMYDTEKLYPVIQKYKLFMEDHNLFYYQRRSSREIFDDIKVNLFYYIKSTNFNKTIIENNFKAWNLDYKENIELVARYIINQKYTKNNDDYHDFVVSIAKLTNKRIETIPVFYQRLYEAKKESDIINVIDNSIQKVKRDRVYDFVVKYHHSNYEKAEKNIRSKFDIYDAYQERKRKEQLEKKKKEKKTFMIAEASFIIKDYIDSNYENIDDYCLNKDLAVKKFKNILSFMKLEDKELYNLYEQKVLSVKQNNYRNMASICKKIMDGINNGILENGAIRSFDLLDYYHITNCDRTTILKILKEVSPKDVKIFGAFLRRYQNSILLNESQVEEILNSKQTIGIEFDKNNNPILGTGYIVTQEEKEIVLNYLREQNIPLYDDVYNIALKKYLNKTLIIEPKKY